MKKIILSVLILFSIFSCCKKDDPEPEVQQHYKLPTDYHIHVYDSTHTEISSQDIHFIYNGRLLTRYESNSVNHYGSYQWKYEYTYSDEDKGLIDRKKEYYNNEYKKYYRYIYDNDKLIRIEHYDAQADTLTYLQEFTYHGDRVIRSRKRSVSGTSDVTEVYTFDGDNLINVKGYYTSDLNSIIYEYDYRYDDKFSPQKNILTNTGPLKGIHNKTYWKTRVYIGSGFLTEMFYQYNYDSEDYPVKRIQTYANSRITTETDIEYTY